MKQLKYAAILIILFGCAGMEPAKESSIESVIDVPGRAKDQIYSSTKIWIAETFNSAKAVIEDDDKEAGRVIGNGLIQYPCSGISCLGKEDWKIGFTMRVDVKDQKFRITFSNIKLSFPASRGSIFVPGIDRPVLQDEFDNAKPALLNLGNLLRAAIDKEKSR
jgi:Domain of unknown function (DUF4468) with TBP-like fold